MIGTSTLTTKRGPRQPKAPFFWKRGLKRKGLAAFYTRGLSPALKPHFLLISPRFFWAGLRPCFSTRSHKTHFFFWGWSYCTAFVFVFSSHVLNLSLKSPTPSIFSLTLDLSDLLPSLSPSIADLTLNPRLTLHLRSEAIPSPIWR